MTTASARTVTWGIIGLGDISRRFAADLPRSGTGVLGAVASRDAERAARFAAEFGAARAYSDYDELLADPDVDAVYVSTVHTEHAAWATRAARAGKHVLCEKPLTPTYAGTLGVVEASRDQGTVLIEGYMFLFHPQTSALLELVSSGAIGSVQHVEASYTFRSSRRAGRLFDPMLAGGGILDVGGYPASAALAIVEAALGSPAAPESLTAQSSLTADGVDEWTTASVVFPGGITAHLSAAVGLAAPGRLTVYGSRGVIDVPSPWVLDPDTHGTLVVRPVGAEEYTVTTAAGSGYALEADALAHAAQDGASPALTGDASLAIARLLDSWRREAGVRYPFERDDIAVPTRDRRPLARRSSAMTYGRIPGVDKDISRLVMGCDNQQDLEFASVMFDDFYERGGNAFDTAYEYSGRLMERLLGQWMSNRGIRDELFVIGKGAHTPYCDPENLESQLLESLDDLQTDHVDLYFMHRDNESVPVGEFVDVLDRHYRAGRIGAFGGSNWTRERFDAANLYAAENGKQGFTALSNHFGLAEAYDLPWAGCRHVTDPESKRWLEEEQIPLFPWASQARGFFARADRDDLSDAQLVRCYYGDGNFERLDRARALAAQLGVAPTAVALAYVLQQNFPTFALIGPRTPTETRTSLAALDIELSPEQIAWLDLR
jgi:predicted dehydrogenase/aryl-alcohol dehydrogenase-like predicted oxidoreductase